MWHSCSMSLTTSKIIWIKQVIFGQNSPLPSNSREGMKLLLLNVFLKMCIMSKYDIKVDPFDFSDEGLMANFDSDDYLFAVIFHEEYNNMLELCQNIKKIGSREKGDLNLNYSTEVRRIYIFNPFENETNFPQWEFT